VEVWQTSNIRPLRLGEEKKEERNKIELEMCTNAQRDGRPAEYRWRPLFNAVKVWLTPTTIVLCSNAAKTRNPLKFAGVPQTTEPISAASGPKFTILCGHVEEILLLKFFSDCRYVPYLRRYSSTNYVMMPRCQLFGDFLGPAFPASRAQHVSDLHSKFALGPHHVSKYGRHPICGR